jgi:hypothetical protein
MKVRVSMAIDISVEINDSFKSLDVPFDAPWTDEDVELAQACREAAKKEVLKTYPYYADLDVYGIYSEETENALGEW